MSVRSFPDTTNETVSLHARGNDTELSIFLPGDPEHFRQLWALHWSYDEKPYPVGGIEIRSPLAPPYDVVRFDITKSGYGNVILGLMGPIFPKGVDLNFVMIGNSNRKELSVVIR